MRLWEGVGQTIRGNSGRGMVKLFEYNNTDDTSSGPLKKNSNMNKLQHLKITKQFLRKVVNYRRIINARGYSDKMTESMVKSLAAIPYNVANIDSFDRMYRYISRKGVQNEVLELIPKNKTGWKVEFQHLVFEANILAGKTAKQREFDF